MRYPALVMVTGVFLACSLGEGDEACAIRAAEPLLTVELVSDSASGAAVPVVFVSNVRYSGFPVLPTSLVDPERAPVRQATAEGDSVRCVVSCGFGSTGGPYELTIAAPGYRARTLTFDADYSTLTNGCPHLQRDGFKLRTTLARL